MHLIDDFHYYASGNTNLHVCSTHCSGSLIRLDFPLDGALISTSVALSNPRIIGIGFDRFLDTDLSLRSACCGSVGRCDLYRQRRPVTTGSYRSLFFGEFDFSYEYVNWAYKIASIS